MNSCVDITAKRRRHQLSLHPSSDAPPPLMLDTASGGGADSADQTLPRPHTLASKLVLWVESRTKLYALYADFLGHGPLSFILCPQHTQY